MIEKKPAKWTEGELKKLIRNAAKESIYLDYKQSDSLSRSERKKRELSKDVSAFANSAGGTLIYGLSEDGHVPIAIDDGIDPREISKEWLEQVINSQIHRRISGIVIHQVDLAVSAPGKVAYVIEIPQSNLAPHQAADYRFYKRFNFQSVPMEEYEIRDVALRMSGPDLKLSMSLDEKPPQPGAVVTLALSATLENLSSVPAEYCTVNLYLDKRMKIEKVGSEYQFLGTKYIDPEGDNIPCEHYFRHLHPQRAMPIYQGAVFDVCDKPFIVTAAEKDYFLIVSRVATGHMSPKHECFCAAWHENNWQLFRSDKIPEELTRGMYFQPRAQPHVASDV